MSHFSKLHGSLASAPEVSPTLHLKHVSTLHGALLSELLRLTHFSTTQGCIAWAPGGIGTAARGTPFHTPGKLCLAHAREAVARHR